MHIYTGGGGCGFFPEYFIPQPVSYACDIIHVVNLFIDIY